MMRRIGLSACCGLLLLGVATTADAARPASRHTGHAGLELPGGRLDRGSRLTAWTIPSSAPLAAWQALRDEIGMAWASWDQHTGVPSRIAAQGLLVPGSVADPARAEAFATDLLRRHVDLLAPGASATDFVLVTNELSHRVRTVALQQQHHGRPVVGGQVSFRFKADRLVVIGSEAYPHVSIPSRSLTVDDSTARAEAGAWLRDDGHTDVRVDGALQGPLVLPIVDAAGVRYREVFAADVQTDRGAGRFVVYVDAETGEPVARQDLVLFGTATLRYNVPLRNPAGPRIDAAASEADGLVSGMPYTTAFDGSLFFDGAAGTLEPSLTGPLVDVINVAGPLVTASFPVADGSTVVWNEGADKEKDAQLTAFVHASAVKAYIRNLDPGFEFLDEQLPTRVNANDDDMTCNASWNGFSINFYIPDAGCENTALLSDVVYHEFGHAVHTEGLVLGVGFFDGALSEGVSDYLGATMTGDPGIGRGFFLDDSPLRQLDPDSWEWRWPEDRGEVHAEGRIIGGALWDLRKIMVDKLGPAAGVAYTDLLYYETHRRAVNIPSMYVEALLFDDDDGNLANGTPNACEINAAYGPHGLFSPGPDAVEVRLLDDLRVQLFTTIPSFPDCPVTAEPMLDWRLRDEPGVGDTVLMTPGFEGGWDAMIPPQADDTVVQYQVSPNYSTGTAAAMPDNFVDPWYETYVGPVTDLYCMSTDGTGEWIFQGNWSTTESMFGDPNDPPFDSDGDGVMVHQPGSYGPGTDAMAWMPRVDTAGFPSVRLQFRRWLTVEDGFYDQAFIQVDGETIWENHASEKDYLATFHHTDREWRFVDFDITELAADGQVDIAFGLRSDQGLHFGGWSLDEVCVVGVGDMDDCGNGVIDPGEECDDGNRAGGDGCDPQCQTEGGDDSGGPGSGSGSGSGGSGGGDTMGDTNGGDTDGATAGFDGDVIGRGCGCSSGGRGGSAFWLVPLFGLIGLGRRRR